MARPHETDGGRPHRTAAVLAVGDELVLGETLDTNSAWISARLLERDVRVVEHATVDDDAGRIAGALVRLSGSVDLLIVTGGLGPTADDLTREGLAAALGEGLVEDAGALRAVEDWFASSGREMPARNRVQAMRPASAVCLANGNGTAPGLRVRLGARAGGLVGARGCDVFCLPGPPRELHPMFEREVPGWVRCAPGGGVRTRLIRTIGLGESEVARRLGTLMDRGRDIVVGTTASRCVVTCRVRGRGDESEASARAFESVCDEVRRRVGEAVFCEGGSEHALEETVLGLLRERRERLATVESCTGGLLGALVTTPAGSSDVYAGGWVTYSNAMKESLVGVPQSLLVAHGAVSGEVASAMAAGGLARSGADHALAITGVAGPGDGSEARPVGTVWIALASRGAGPDVRCFRFRGGREAVREWSARTALAMLRLRLVGASMALLGEVGSAALPREQSSRRGGEQ